VRRVDAGRDARIAAVAPPAFGVNFMMVLDMTEQLAPAVWALLALFALSVVVIAFAVAAARGPRIVWRSGQGQVPRRRTRRSERVRLRDVSLSRA